MPAALLKQNPEDMDIDEFVEAVAKARHIQNLRAIEVAIGVGMAFSE